MRTRKFSRTTSFPGSLFFAPQGPWERGCVVGPLSVRVLPIKLCTTVSRSFHEIRYWLAIEKPLLINISQTTKANVDRLTLRLGRLLAKRQHKNRAEKRTTLYVSQARKAITELTLRILVYISQATSASVKQNLFTFRKPKRPT